MELLYPKFTKEDYMRLPKERLAEMLVVRDSEPTVKFNPMYLGVEKCLFDDNACTNPSKSCVCCSRRPAYITSTNVAEMLKE